MAPKGSCPCCSLRRNLFPIDHIEDELAKNPGPTNSFYLGNTSPTPFHNPTPGPALVFALIPTPVPAPVPTLTPVLSSSDELFRQFMKAYLKSNQDPRQPLAKRKQLFKAKVPQVYYGKLHIDCYHFCQQCEDYFETAKATGANRTLFVAFFLHKNISVY